MEKALSMEAFTELDEREVMKTDGGKILSDFFNGINYLIDKKIWGKADAAANKFIMEHPDHPTSQLYMKYPRG